MMKKLLARLGRLATRRPAPVGTADDGVDRHLRLGIAVMVFLVVGGGGWAAMASLNGAIVTAGTVVVDSYAKRVQHPEGGVVGRILVQNGQKVEANTVVLRLDDTVTLANLGVVDTQMVELAARRARLEAERDGRPGMDDPSYLAGRRGQENVARAIDGERSLFVSRRSAVDGQVAQLKAQIGQFYDEAAGLSAQIAAKNAELGYIEEEIAGAEELHAKGLTPLTRLRSLQREKVRIEGERGQLQADLARSQGRASETELKIIQIDQDMRAEVIKELRELEGKWAELQERRIAAQDKLTRVDLRAPISGVVHELAVHTVGGVISPGETVMMIVPEKDKLVVEIQISPADIDQVSIGQPAMVRLSAFSQKTTPELHGSVARVAADLTKDEKAGTSFYLARVELPPEEIARLGGLQLMPGMPAEVHLQTGERTALSYLVKPLRDQIARAMREE
ncbi:Type I secretion system membrane fusion protein PrsE [Starkeya nomas]|uniref:Membrane fusion protein (MFP) family protein n=1 Tax=Starkeya nomas TaxID=2666134 RepID=A0A5S9P9X0_9HYPH|nr:Type I secretion system membrane fusion protein PrsE [Starkeya nomas]